MRRLLNRIASGLLVAAASVSVAQAAGPFNPGANGDVLAIAVQPDGKILVGGDFTALGGGTGTTARNNIGRLNADGSVDTSFNPGADDIVWAFVVQPDGKIVVGGEFSTLGGATRRRLGRLNADGSIDTTFNPGVDSSVRALARQSDGRLVVGGRFTMLGGGGTGTTARKYIGRLTADGSLDTTFNPGADYDVRALAVQADGRILAGGFFSMLGGGTGTTARNGIGRLNADGSVDPTFNPNASGLVRTIVPQSDGRILVGGDFITMGGAARRRLARLNADGSVDAGFTGGAGDPATASSTSYEVHTLAVQSDGKVIVGGSFPTLGPGGVSRLNIGRLNADGSLDSAFNPGTSGSDNYAPVYALVVQADRSIIVGGGFESLAGTARRRIGRLNSDGSIEVGQTCGYSLSSSSLSLAGAAGSGSVTVAADASNAPACSWTATADVSWLTVTGGGSGTGPGTVTFSATANSSEVTRAGTLTIAGRTFTVTQTPVTLAPAFGTLDTPLNNTLGLNGSIAVTGWALDDVEVTEVQVWRDPHSSDPPGAIVGGATPQGGKVFVGYASLVNGARPDVETLYPTHPFKSRAGWGYLLLTRGLIWDGKGTFKLYAIAADKDGHLSLLGSTTISIDNASATKPFGAIDTPGQGATASGLYPNTGWVLTPNGGALIGADKVQVAIDGVFLPGTFSMSDRTDISGGFAQFTTTGAGRGLFIDTTKYSDGPHTIGWLVTDSGGKADGVGSRFFTVANGTSGMRIVEREPATGEIGALPLEATALRARRGWDTDADLTWREADRDGRIAIDGHELDRLELRLDEAVSAQWRGYLRVAGTLRALPAGSHLAADGTFTWQPGVGFVGSYDFLFLRTSRDSIISRREIRIVLHAGNSKN